MALTPRIRLGIIACGDITLHAWNILYLSLFSKHLRKLNMTVLVAYDALQFGTQSENHKTLQVEDHPPNNNCCFWYLHVQKFLCFVSITNFLPCWLRKRKLFSCECANVRCTIELRWLELSLTRLTISNTTHTATSNAEFEVRYYSAKTWIHCRR